MKDKLQITAYEVVEQAMAIRCAERNREWIEALPERFAYRCLPLVIANQVGCILPYPRHYAAKFDAAIRNINEDPKLYQHYTGWREARLQINETLKEAGSAAAKQGWQRTYMKGEHPSGNTFAGHQTKVLMKAFKRG